MKTTSSILIQASAEKLWAVLTLPNFTKDYMFNCEVKTDWKIGNPITWEGEFQGYKAFQKGEVLVYEALSELSYSTFDPNFGLEDKPENYIHVSYHINQMKNKVELTISNETFDNNTERLKHIEQGWGIVIPLIKKCAEAI